MPVYNKPGQETAVYNKQGIRLSQCFEKDGNPMLEIIGPDYYENENGARTNIGLQSLGSLKYGQSFCKYDGKYYSTNGTNLAEQDASFSVLRDVTINLGHGNALQLGSNGLAYASGWDDQTIYIVNLSSMSVVGTIALPTTGYTTCAVDDINQMAYIWQRDTRPNTESAYNFIVYDYANGHIVSTTQTDVAFGAMQAVDMYDGKFLVLNGLGTDALPNGYRWYDKTGEIVASYIIGTQAAVEPEGVIVDRSAGTVEISYADKKLYKIKMNKE